ncbi:MAG: hypothetical protein WBA23_23350 [Tunicatimonas sp.]|uniref:hypothetical protein n=1 Tax=Tunicatimonas sp. TaxID=1940096 RepID=UPI003C795E76
MSFNVSQLPRLRRHSGQRVSNSIIHGFAAYSGGQTRLIRPQFRSGQGIVQVPRNGVSNVLQGLRSVQRVMTFGSSHRGFMARLNQSLKGGESYPALIFALGLAFVPLGTVGTVGGVIFGASTAAFDSARRSTSVLAREGDEIWHVEEVGRTFEDNYIQDDRWIATHISSFFLVDPFRRQNTEKGWLLHEGRRTIEMT